MSVGDDDDDRGGGVDDDSGEQQEKPNLRVSWGCSKYLFTKYMIFFYLLPDLWRSGKSLETINILMCFQPEIRLHAKYILKAAL